MSNLKSLFCALYINKILPFAATQPEVKGRTKKRKQVSKEKVKQYKRNGGSKYEASWIGPETRKLYPTGWKNGKKIFYRQKIKSPKEALPHLTSGIWTSQKTTIYHMFKKHHRERVHMQQESGQEEQSCGRLTSHRLNTLTQL